MTEKTTLTDAVHTLLKRAIIEQAIEDAKEEPFDVFED